MPEYMASGTSRTTLMRAPAIGCIAKRRSTPTCACPPPTRTRSARGSRVTGAIAAPPAREVKRARRPRSLTQDWPRRPNADASPLAALRSLRRSSATARSRALPSARLGARAYRASLGSGSSVAQHAAGDPGEVDRAGDAEAVVGPERLCGGAQRELGVRDDAQREIRRGGGRGRGDPGGLEGALRLGAGEGRLAREREAGVEDRREVLPRRDRE